MPLRKATGNQYEFITHIWNPVKGKYWRKSSPKRPKAD